MLVPGYRERPGSALGTVFADRRLILLAVVPVVLWTVLLLAWAPTFWSLVFDDSFYYWQIGRNLASGAGTTFDGIHFTNGYHPLWLLFCSALYAAGLGPDAAPVIAMVVQVALFGLAWWLLGAAALRVLATVPNATPRLERFTLGLLLVVACCQPLLKTWVNGLESTFVLLAQVALLGLLLRTRDLLAPDAVRARLTVGALVALAFLARTDNALLLPALGMWALPRLWRDPRATWVAALQLLAGPTVVVMAYMGVNQAVFGTAVQVSGMLKSPTLEWWRLLVAVAIVVLPMVAAERLATARWPRLRFTLNRTAPFGLHTLLLTAYYGALQVFPRVWYFGPALLYLVLLGAVALADLIALAESEASGRSLSRVQALALGATGAVLVGLSGVQVFAAPSATPLLANREAGRYIAENLPADAVLASWDAGVLAYYAQRPVVNLDGVVNSAGYLGALRNGTTAHYLAEVPIGWVANHAEDEEQLRAAAVASLGQRAAGLQIEQSWPFEVFAGVNQALPQSQSLQVYLAKLR